MTYAPSFKFARTYLQRRAAVLLSHTCVISRPATPGSDVSYNPTTKKATTTAPTAVYVGSCRLWSIDAPSEFFYQDREAHKGSTNLSLPSFATGIRPNDLVTITDHTDPEVIGRSLVVTQLNRGGELRGSRVMSVEFTDYVEAPDE